ncbi:MAG: NADH-quinone oxidoreductase subunit N [Planctomycetaceae bacterium]
MTDYSLINSAIERIVPEVILLAAVCVMFLTAPFLATETGDVARGLRHRWGILSLAAIAAAGIAWWHSPVLVSSAGFFRADEFAWFVRGLSLAGGTLLALVLWDQIDDGHSAEAHACLLAIIAGTNFVAAANDLVGLFLGLELVSIPTYVLLYLPRRDRLTREATIKYFLLSIFSSAFVLYGLAWIFGIAGTTSMTAIANRLSASVQSGDPMMMKLALVLLLAGLSFRVAAVPFHFYAPDVFQGVTSSSAAMLSFVPKLVGLTALLRLLSMSAGSTTLLHWVPGPAVSALLSTLAVLTMIVGNVLALRQQHLHRLLAYSSIAHAGYMLVGLTIGDHAASASGVTSMLFYLAIYGVMTIGVFAMIAAAGSAERPVRAVTDLAGLSRTQPVAAVLMTVCLFGLSGLPPTAGFLGKLNLFLAAWSDSSTVGCVLAVVLAVNAVISAYYYLRIVAVMYLDAATDTEPQRHSVAAMAAGGICAVAAIALFAAPQWLWNAAAAGRGQAQDVPGVIPLQADGQPDASAPAGEVFAEVAGQPGIERHIFRDGFAIPELHAADDSIHGTSLEGSDGHDIPVQINPLHSRASEHVLTSGQAVVNSGQQAERCDSGIRAVNGHRVAVGKRFTIHVSVGRDASKIQ